MSEASPFSGYEIKYKCGERGWGIWDTEREGSLDAPLKGGWHSTAVYTTTADAIDALDLLNSGQIELDQVQDMRKLLRSRGITPGKDTPTCDVCGTWTATHTIGDILVCDKSRCQDKAVVKETTMESKQYTAQELADEVTKGPKVGDKVHDNTSGYNATIIAARDVRLYTIQVDLYGSKFDLTREADQFKPIVELSQEEAWTELPISVMRLLKAYQIRSDIPIYADSQKAIRHDCYVLLGTSHVKITPEVKARVRAVIDNVAEVLHIGLG